MRIFIYSPDLSTSRYYRAELVKRYFDRHPELGVTCVVSHLLPAMLSPKDWDVLHIVYITADPFAFPLDLLKSWRDAGGALSVDCDDLIFEIPTWHPHFGKFNAWQTQDFFHELYSMADVVTVTTNHLAKEFRRHVSRQYHICPNGYDVTLKIHRPPFVPKVVDDRPIVGYAGGGQHTYDLYVMNTVWNKLLASGLQLHFIGCDPSGVMGKPGTVFMSGSGIAPEVYFQALPFMDWDVAVAPLAECPINHCKSPIKVLEYRWLIGCPVVCSNSRTYDEIKEDSGYVFKVDGFKPERWIDAIKGALAVTRTKGRKYYLPPEFDLEVTGSSWLSAFEDAVQIRKGRDNEVS